MSKIYDPLLEPGIHDSTVEDVRETCVKAFGNGGNKGNPPAREEIMDRFEEFISELRSFSTEFEVWVDGSFVTEKPQPNDVDVVIFGDLSPLIPSEVRRFKLLRDYAEQRYRTDAYFVPEGSPQDRSYWRGWFTFNREEEPKGIFSIELN